MLDLDSALLAPGYLFGAIAIVLVAYIIYELLPLISRKRHWHVVQMSGSKFAVRRRHPVYGWQFLDANDGYTTWGAESDSVRKYAIFDTLEEATEGARCGTIGAPQNPQQA